MKSAAWQFHYGELFRHTLKNEICTVCITEVYFACGEDTHTLRLTSELVDLRVGVCEVDSTSKARRTVSLKLRKYDASCCIIFTEGYRSGHNEAVLKICSREFLQSAKKP